MTEEQIERQVERQMDRLDSHLMARRLTQAEYDSEVKKLNVWADNQYERTPIWRR